jgi:fumarate hydratase class II
MSNVRIQNDGPRKVEVPAAKLWGAAQTQRSLEQCRKNVDRSLMPATALTPVIGCDKASKIAHQTFDLIGELANIVRRDVAAMT